MAAHISQVSAGIAAAPASSGWPVWGVIAALAAGVVVAALVVLAIAARHPRHMIVRQRQPRLWAGRDERIKRAAAADVEVLEKDANLVSPDAPGASEDEL